MNETTTPEYIPREEAILSDEAMDLFYKTIGEYLNTLPEDQRSFLAEPNNTTMTFEPTEGFLIIRVLQAHTGQLLMPVFIPNNHWRRKGTENPCD